MTTSIEPPEVIVGLDLGSTKVTAVVGEVDDEGITILGVGNVPCRGLRKGVVTNIDWTVRAIREAVDAAQNCAGVEIDTVYAAVGGSHVRSIPSHGMCAVAAREVSPSDVDRVLEAARAVPVDADRMILHVLPREYLVDTQDGIRDPIGMAGVRLQTRVNLVTAATSNIQNVVRCVERCGLDIADVVLSPYASAEAVLSDDEKEIGVVVIDIGGGTTDIIAYSEGGIAHASVIPVGGNNITSDLAAGLRTPTGEAERLKRNYGCALGRMVGDEEEVEVPGVGGHAARQAPRRFVSEIIEPRAEEIFHEIRRRMEESGLIELASAGAVLTGGANLMEGMVESAEDILGMPVRMGFPAGVSGLTQLVQGPQYAAGVGLLHYGARQIAEAEEADYEASLSGEGTPDESGAISMGRGFMGWLRGAF
ncbi:MAG: cell division protein FtsA [Polyangiaceae bacterium]|nr:cell division protein FtsA [Polyangiaceae bacterium]